MVHFILWISIGVVVPRRGADLPLNLTVLKVDGVKNFTLAHKISSKILSVPPRLILYSTVYREWYSHSPNLVSIFSGGPKKIERGQRR